jgi:hypothetical protein
MSKSVFIGMLLLGTGVFGQDVVVKPQETDELLANPGIGWETFHHPSKQDKNLPSWIPSTIHYARWSCTSFDWPLRIEKCGNRHAE